MAGGTDHSAEVTIRNRMGFHVRPVQRFAELARAFKAEVEVGLGSRTVPGKSVINLVSLGGRCGDRLKISARGDDARLCVDVLRFLAESRFFVEDDVDVDKSPSRHLERLARIASCFESEIAVVYDAGNADAKQFEALSSLGLSPTSEPTFEVKGGDAEQARAVLETLVDSCFYVEEVMGQRGRRGT
jgi:phosphotransferase system HPr (HPr) family protein